MPTAQPAATVFTAENILIAVVLIVIYGGTTLTDRRSLPGPLTPRQHPDRSTPER